MKKIICCLLLSIAFTGCEEPGKNQPPPKKKKKFTIGVHSGEGMSSGFTEVECDSFFMVKKNECIIWSDGTKNRIIATDILPSSN